MRNSILILGGGFDQLPAVHSVNKLGYASIVADFNENCISSTYCDLFIHKSNRDVEGIYEELNKYKNKYKIILVFVIGTDIPVEACLLNDKFNIKSGFSIDIAKLSVDKLNLKKTLRKLKFNVPNVELYDKNKDYEFPLVVKPNGLAGSRGVLLSRSKNEFNDNINFIKNNYSNSEILIEEMIEGDQISSEHIIYEGQVFTFGLALRNYEDSKNFYPHIIENGGIQCHPKVLKILEDIEKCVNTISNKLNINNSILKFDLIIKKDKIYILEMATRMSGGDFASSIIPLSIGTDYITIAIESLIKQKDFIDILKQKSIKKEKKYLLVSNRYLMPEKEGVFSDIIWPKENYLKIEEFLMKKEKYKKPTHHGERMAVFVLSDYILSNLEKRIKNVYRSLIINYENNWRNK